MTCAYNSAHLVVNVVINLAYKVESNISKSNKL